MRALWLLAAFKNAAREWLRELPVNLAWCAGDMTYCGCNRWPDAQGHHLPGGHVFADHQREVLPVWRERFLGA